MHRNVGEVIGEGGFAKVMVATYNNDYVAMKLVDLSTEPNRIAFMNERIALSQLQSAKKRKEYLCEFIEIGERDDSSGFVTMKKYDTDLYEFAFKDGNTRMNEKMAQKIFQRICKGVKSLHKMGIAHLDLKPENILIDIKSSKPYICDFGAAWVSPNNKRKNLEESASVPNLGRRGSAQYASPEMLKNPERYDPYRSDIYSLGVLLHNLLLGHYPPPIELRVEQKVTLDYLFNEGISPACCSLIISMLEVSPKTRFTIDKVLKHPWCATGMPLLKSFRRFSAV